MMIDKLELSDEAFCIIERAAQDDMEFIYERVFFFGQIFEDFPLSAEREFEDYPHACCPCCGELIKLPKRPKPKNYDDITCPKCGNDGTLFDFHDKSLDLDSYLMSKLAYLESLDDGYVLRLFNVGLLYSVRDYSDYTKLTFYPNMYVHEVGREYWYNGKVEYYENDALYCEMQDFRRCETINYDDEYTILNFDCEKSSNPMLDSQFIGDMLYQIKSNYNANSFMDAISRSLSYKTYATLKRYKFDNLVEDYIYQCDTLPKSNKISEILGVDYNQLAAFNCPEIMTYEDLEYARKLATFNMKPTEQNIKIIAELNTDILGDFDVKKTFKYLRNLMNKLNSSNAVRDYNDYISDCVRLKYDISSNEIRYPSKFMEKHTQYAMLVNAEKNRSKLKEFKAALKQFAEISKYQNNNYIVRIVRTPTELKTEGNILHHCVGGYVERICKGNCLIFFVRSILEPNTPYYTLEYRPKDNKLIQCRGYENCDYTENHAIKETVDEWLRWVNITKKEQVSS